MKTTASRFYESLPWILGAVFCLAFLLRLAFVYDWFATPYGESPFLDAQAYNDWAKEIAGGHVLRHSAFYLSPLLPYVLGLLYAIFGYSLWIPSLFNAVLGAATCALLSHLAFRAFGPVAAITTGILAASYKPFIFYTAPVMKESLVLFLMTLFVSFAYSAMKTNASRAFLWSGLFLGLCAIVRGNVLAFALVIPCFVYFRNRPARLRNSAAFLAGVCLAILPITLHNAIASDDFVLVSYSDGFNLYIGHNPAATGTSYVFPPGVTSSPEREEYDITRIASQALGHPLRPSEVSDFWRAQAIDYARAHPMREFQLLFEKFTAFWSNNEPFDNYDMRFIEDHFDTLLSWPLPCFGILVFMAVFAGWALRRSHRADVLFFAALTCVYMGTLFPFYVTDRYRLPVVICFLPLAGAMIPAAIRYLRTKEIRRLAGTTLLALLALGLTLWPEDAESGDDAAYNWSVLSTLYEDQGYDLAAVEAFDQALAVNPMRVGADAWIKISDAKAHLGYPDESEGVLQEAMKRYPSDGSVTYNYGRIKLLNGEFPEAYAAFQKAVEQTPTFTPSYRGLAVVYDHYGNRAKAIDVVRQGLAIVPVDPSLNEVLAQLLNLSDAR